MEFKLNLDIASILKELESEMKRNAQITLLAKIKGFFSTAQYRSVSGELITTKGDGTKEIEEMIDNQFLDPKFRKSLDDYFESNWQRIFQECMEKAMQHKANAIVFGKKTP